MHNIEPLAATRAEGVINAVPPADAERLATKAAHVLAAQGLYAFGLFLATRKRAQDKAPAEAIHAASHGLLNDLELLTDDDLQRVPERPAFYRELTAVRPGETSAAALQRLLLVRGVVEDLLVYIRYAAKAAPGCGE